MNLRKFFITVSNRHDLYYRWFLILLSIFAITNNLPHQLRFKYDYKIGGLWNYDNLKAPFDFPVYKTEKVIDAEKKLILEKIS